MTAKMPAATCAAMQVEALLTGVPVTPIEYPLVGDGKVYRYRGFVIAEHWNSGGMWWSCVPEDAAERRAWDAMDPDGEIPDCKLLSQAVDAIDSWRAA